MENLSNSSRVPPPIPKMKLNVENLSGAIREAAERETMRANAKALSEKIRREDGLIETVRWVERFLA